MSSENTARALAIVGLLLIPAAARADEPKFDPDFIFNFQACRIDGSTLGAPSSKNDGFTGMTTKSHTTACERMGKRDLQCVTVFEEAGAKPVVYDMHISTEMAQLLIIQSENGGDFLVAKPETGRIVSTTRLLTESSVAVKLCHGMYLTGDEFKEMEKRRRTRK